MDFCVSSSDAEKIFQPSTLIDSLIKCRNSSAHSDEIRSVYLESFEGSPDSLRMALLNPLIVNGVLSNWYGVGGSSTLGYSDIPTLGYGYSRSGISTAPD